MINTDEPQGSTRSRLRWRARQVRPDCTSEEEWLDWLDSSALYTRGRRVSFCHDCTPEFKAESIGLGLCSFPDTYFETIHNEDGEEEVIGVQWSAAQFLEDEVEPEDYDSPEEHAPGVGGWGWGELVEVSRLLRQEPDSEVRFEEYLGQLRSEEPGESPGD